ncbi:MAG: WecB/TagA/CpsF family glycosyltransferase [Candidatus Omnitrophota bacterium]|nr:WecB/TagA/CpsF family glycosyltransferase [Candidatus Omnitrophota bacterium]
MKNRVDVLGVMIDNLTREEAVSEIDALIKKNKPSMVCTANANHVRLARADAQFAAIYNEADIVTGDGMPVIWASKLLGRPLRDRVSGIDLVEEICRRSAARGYRIYFLGASMGIAEKAKERCERLYPGVQIVGSYSPARSEILDDNKSLAIVDKINGSGANILCVAFGPPLQEKWMKKHMHLLKTPVSIGVGGTLDYLAGIIKRPPPIVQKMGMEWFARLIQDPARYWKRYLKDFVFFYYLFLEITKTARFK